MNKRKREDSPNKNEDNIDDVDQAFEDNLIIDDDDHSVSSEGSGEDLMNNMEKDYKPIAELDNYEMEDLDEEKYSELDPEDRRKIDEQLNERDKERIVYTKRIPKAILDELENEEAEEDLLTRRRKLNQFTQGSGQYNEEEYRNTENYINREDVKGKITEWLRQPHVIRYIQQTFSKFIKTYKDQDNNLIYEHRIIEMATSNKQSLDVNFSHVTEVNQYVANWIQTYPALVIPHLNTIAFSLTCEIFPNYSNIRNETFVRIKNLPLVDNLRDLRHNHLDSLINIRGVLTKRTNVLPILKKMIFYCTKCGEKKGPFFYNGGEELLLGSCLVCQSSGPFNLVQSETLYRNYQRVTIQESPGTVPPGRLPRQKEVILNDDLVDTVRPGDEVEITGIFESKFDISTNIRHCFPIFSTSIVANSVSKLNELESTELTDEDKIEIRKLAKNPNITNILFNSIAPSIYGNEFNKKALAIAMFGGISKDIESKHRVRGDINVLLLGDPGMAKSQFLKYVQKVFHRSVYTTGKGASAVGLTAGVHKDPVTKEWTLEGGALVLADKGICLIDEFDKMNDQDRTSIHEAMEQQSISVSKAGIVTTLQARCSVIAAANPIKGRYDNQLTFADNVNLTEPILSRFDILCVIKDEIDMITDEKLSTFVINSHILSHPGYNQEYDNKVLLPDRERETKETIPQELLKKYILYARRYILPKNSDLNKNKVSKFYSELRKESEVVGGISIAVRHLESLLRISEAHAKMRLSDYVRADDVDFAIKIMLESFLMSQKSSINKNLRKKFRHYLTMHEDHTQLLMNILNKNLNEQLSYLKYFNKPIDTNEFNISIEKFEKDAQDTGLSSFKEFYASRMFQSRYRIKDNKIYYVLA